MELSDNELNEVKEFLNTHPKSHFLQSPEWAKLKSSWIHEMIIVRDDNNKIKGTMSVLIRKTPLFGRSIMYAGRGFVCDIDDKDTLEKLTIEAKKLAKKYKAFIFRMDPDIPVDNKDFLNLMLSLGYKEKQNIKSIDDVIQPKYVMRLNIKDHTEDSLIATFHSKTRYNIRLSIKKGVIIREGTTDEDIEIFHKIMKETGSRDDFFIRDSSYFKKLYECLGKEHVKILIAEHEGTPIAVAMPVLYGDKVWYLYGGSSNQYRNLMATYLVQWEMIKWGLENKCSIYDFRGITGYWDENSPQYGVYKFKKGFNGDEVEFVNELYMVFNPVINTIWKIAEKTYKFIGITKERIKNLGKN